MTGSKAWKASVSEKASLEAGMSAELSLSKSWNHKFIRKSNKARRIHQTHSARVYGECVQQSIVQQINSDDLSMSESSLRVDNFAPFSTCVPWERAASCQRRSPCLCLCSRSFGVSGLALRLHSALHVDSAQDTHI